MLSPVTAFSSEQVLTAKQNGVQAYVSSPINCNSLMKVSVKADNSNAFTGDKIALQENLGLIQAALGFECSNQVTEILIDGQINNQTVYKGMAEKSNNWLLHDIKNDIQSAHSTNASHAPITNLSPAASTVSANNQCDALAAHPNDHRKEANIYGVSDSQLNVDQALDACIDAVASNDTNSRYNFQLGRVLYVSGVYDEARIYLQNALSSSYPAADYYLAMINLQDEANDGANALSRLEKIKSEFKPAKAFLDDYETELAAEKAQVKIQKTNQNFSFLNRNIASDSFNYAQNFNSFAHDTLLTKNDYAITAVMGEHILKEMQGWCSHVIDKADIRTVTDYVEATPPSNAYLNYAKKYQVKLSDNPMYKLFGGAQTMQQADNKLLNMHMNDRIRRSDDIQFGVSTDAGNLVKRYDCEDKEITALVSNIVNFAETAPPYNTVSEPYWNACMKT